MEQLAKQPTYDCLIITEDNTQLASFQKRFVRRLGQMYLRWYAKKIDGLYNELNRQGKSVAVIGNREVFQYMKAKGFIQFILIDQAIEEVEFEKVGQSAALLSEQFDKQSLVALPGGKLCFNSISISEIAFVQIAFQFYFYSLLYCEMLQNLVKTHQFQNIYLMNRKSILEQVARQFFRGQGNEPRVRFPSSILIRLRNVIIDFLYSRDRSLRLRKLRTVKNEMVIQKKSVEPTKIIMVACHVSHLKIAIPLIHKLKLMGISSHLVIVPMTKKEEELLKQSGVSWSYATNYLANGESGKLEKEFRLQTKCAWENLLQREVNEKNFTIGKVDMFDANKQKLNVFVKKSLTEALLYATMAQKVINFHQPKIIVAFSDARFFEASSAWLARAQGIQTVQITTNAVMSPDAINRYNTCEHVAVCGDHIKNRLIQRGDIQPSSIYVVGDIRFDFLAEEKSSFTPEKVRQDLGVRPECKIALLTSFYTTSWHPIEEKILFLRKGYETIRKLSGFKLVIKAHPNENEFLLKQLLCEQGIEDVVATKHYSLYQLLLSSEFVIALSSSMAPLEAMILGIPVLGFNMTRKCSDKTLGFIKSDAVIGFNEKTDLVSIAEHLISDRKFYQDRVNNGLTFASHYVAQPIGHAGDRIVQLLINDLKKV